VEVFTDPLWVFVLTLCHGVFRFVPLEWLAVLFGFAVSVGGVALAGAAAIRLGRLQGHAHVLHRPARRRGWYTGIRFRAELVIAVIGLSWALISGASFRDTSPGINYHNRDRE
jgi:hypothetical protein